jgi:transposase
MRAYSIDLRQRALQDVDGGMTTRLAALKYDGSESWARRLKQRRRETGEVTPRSSRNGVKPKWLPLADELTRRVREKPDMTLRELRAAMGEQVGVQTLSRALGLTLKKGNPCRRAGPPRRANAARRVATGDARA